MDTLSCLQPSKPEDRAPEGVVKAIRKREPNGQWSEVALDPKLTVDHDVSPAKGSRGKEKDRGSIVVEAKFHPFNRAVRLPHSHAMACGKRLSKLRSSHYISSVAL
jgi:hypothetical protein